jgi:predicted nucleic-acid-binding Zn-ribbon protein
LKPENDFSINRSVLILILVVILVFAGCIVSAFNQPYNSKSSSGSNATFFLQPSISNHYFHTPTNSNGFNNFQTPEAVIPKNFNYSKSKLFFFESTKGSIYVDSIPPGAIVILDGKTTGKTTPAKIENIHTGNHQIRCRMSGYSDRYQVVMVNADKTTNIVFNFDDQKGSIYVDSTPSGALVILDGKTTGKTTPATIEGILVGNHQIRCRMNGYTEHFQTVAVNGNQTTNVTLDLRDSPIGSIYVDSDPSGASIYLDGFDMDYNTPATLSFISAGSHTVLCKMSGYPDQSQSVIVYSGQTTSVLITFEKTK